MANDQASADHMQSTSRDLAAAKFMTRHTPEWMLSADKRGLIYFLGAGPDFVKIGLARDPARRAAELQVGNPYKLIVLASVKGGRVKEREYHRRFAEHRAVGEWFARCPEIEAEIARLEDNCQRAAA